MKEKRALVTVIDGALPDPLVRRRHIKRYSTCRASGCFPSQRHWPYSYNLAAIYLKANRFQDAITSFAKALEIFKRESGDHAPVVSYTLLGAAQAYGKIGDDASSQTLLATAIEILGPTIAAQRSQPRWL